jgi:predicted dehydrogenase
MVASPLRIGILGAARIARKFVEGVADSDKVSVVAVSSRDRARATAFAEPYGIPLSFGSYESMLASDAIDAVYNPLPNGLHADWSIRAMDAGKHVLCEKPLAASRREAMQMFEAAERNRVCLAEAYPYRSQPQTLMMKKLIDDGAIGRVRMISAAFGFTLTAVDDIRLDPALAGGALMDLGSYPLSLIRMLAGEMPTAMQVLGEWDVNGIDRTAMATLQFANGMLAQASCSFETAIHRQALIAGDDGILETTYANHTLNAAAPVLLLRRGTERVDVPEVITVDPMNGFRAEAEAFVDYTRGAPWTGISERESLDVAEMLERLRRPAPGVAGGR